MSIAQARLFNKNYLSDLLAHPQEYYLNVHSMEVLRSELPHVHDRFLRDMLDARSNDNDGEEEPASSCWPAHLAQNKFASLLLRKARCDDRRCNDGPATSDGEGVTTYRKNNQLCPPRRAVVVVKVKPEARRKEQRLCRSPRPDYLIKTIYLTSLRIRRSTTSTYTAWRF